MSANFFHDNNRENYAKAGNQEPGSPAQTEASPFLGVFDLISSRMQELERLHATHATLFDDLSRQNELFREKILKNQAAWLEHQKNSAKANEAQNKEREERIRVQCLSEAKSEIAKQIEMEKRRNSLELAVIKAEYAKAQEQTWSRLENYAAKDVTYAKIQSLEVEFGKVLSSLQAAMAIASQSEEILGARIDEMGSRNKVEITAQAEKSHKLLAAELAKTKAENERLQQQSFRHLSAKIQATEAKYSEVKAALDAARAQANSLASQTKAEAAAQLEAGKKQLLGQFEALKAENRNFQQHVQLDVGKTLEKAAQLKTQSLEAEYDKIKGALASAVADAKKREETALARAEELTSICDQIKLELLTARKPFEEAQIALQSKIDDCVRELGNANQAIEALRKENESLKRRFQAELNAALGERASMQEDLTSARKDLDEERAEINRLGELLRANETALSNSRLELAKLRTGAAPGPASDH
ncbi:MAG: hypothetical protein P4M08_05990 [Oligoflexia bacterium]|nr:hypothetical protein [Oligoflexia bacterium]